MRIDLVCFTDRGWALGRELEHALLDAGERVALARCGRDRPLGEWVADCFHETDGLVFIGAVGIAVRAVAPMLSSKASDPAVVVVDDCGKFAVSLLSGHLGGANELTDRIAGFIGATVVVTTATDINMVFAVDSWARKAGLIVLNPERIKTVSAKLLAGGTVGLESAFPVGGALPEGVVLREDAADVVIEYRRENSPDPLWLIAPAVVLGIGCRKNTSSEAIERAFQQFQRATGIHLQAFGKVCSINLKQDEPGLAAFCRNNSLPFETFSSGALAAVKGEFGSSAFVSAVTGVDNVCERSAVAGSGGGSLIAERTIVDGIAMAAALSPYTVRFDDGDGNSA